MTRKRKLEPEPEPYLITTSRGYNDNYTSTNAVVITYGWRYVQPRRESTGLRALLRRLLRRS